MPKKVTVAQVADLLGGLKDIAKESLQDDPLYEVQGNNLLDLLYKLTELSQDADLVRHLRQEIRYLESIGWEP